VVIRTGRDVAAERARSGVSQATLAEALGTSKVMISFLEVQSEYIAPTREFARRIEEALARLETQERERVA
jgi:ribosome-binding protein aMBF1 (putative translation factor)